MTGNEPSKMTRPADGSFDNPAASISSLRLAILVGPPNSAAAIVANENSVADCQSLMELVADISSIRDDGLRQMLRDRIVEQRFGQSDFRETGAFRSERKSESQRLRLAG